MSITLLATDLDDTLLGDDNAMYRLNAALSDLRDQGKLKLVYVTGRSTQRYELLKSEKDVLEPDALIPALGTEIFVKGQKLELWPNVPEWDNSLIKARLAHISALTLQPDAELREHKISYYLHDDPDSLQAVETALHDLPVDITYSNNKYLDVLPKGINKGSAVRFLAEMWGIALGDVIACGDSGNDVSMLKDYKAIVVGNAKPELLKWVEENREAAVYLATHEFANGMAEGLEHYQVLCR